jgi:tetratricopeptide (TPR) repeat protein
MALTALVVMRLTGSSTAPPSPQPSPAAPVPASLSRAIPPTSAAAIGPRPVAPQRPMLAAEPAVAPRPQSRPRPGARPAGHPPKAREPRDALAPEREEARRTLGEARAALTAGRYAQAENLFGRVRATGAERAAALTGLAEVAFQRASYADAARVGRGAVIAGGGVAAKLVLGNAYFKLGRYDEAIAEYQDILKVDHGHAEARANLAAAQKRKGG